MANPAAGYELAGESRKQPTCDHRWSPALRRRDAVTVNPLNLTIILLTFNEEGRVEACLQSVEGIDAPVFAVDSFSTDRTRAILEACGAHVVQHVFEGYAKQRNWAQANNPFHSDWVLHLDADERLTPELRRWLIRDFPQLAPSCDGFMFSRRTVFLGRWIRHGGHYPSYHLRLFRAALGRCETKAYDQHFLVNGRTRIVPNADIIDVVARSLTDFVASHNRWSSLEAAEMLSGTFSEEVVRPTLTGNPIGRRRWLKSKMFGRAPLFARSFAYFVYRYVFRLGFLDGREGLIFHVLQGFWFRFLVDAKYHEILHERGRIPDTKEDA